MMSLVMANDLLTFFVALELMSLAVYVLTGAWRRSARYGPDSAIVTSTVVFAPMRRTCLHLFNLFFG